MAGWCINRHNEQTRDRTMEPEGLVADGLVQTLYSRLSTIIALIGSQVGTLTKVGDTGYGDATVDSGVDLCTAVDKERTFTQMSEGGRRNLASGRACCDEFLMIGDVDKLGRVSALKLTGDYLHACEGGVNLKTSIVAIFAVFALFVFAGVLVYLIGGGIVVDGDTVGEPHGMTRCNLLIDAIGIGLVTDRLERHTRTVVHDDVACIVVLVEALCLVADSETAVEIDIHGSLIGTHLEAIAITVGGYVVDVEKTVLIGNTILYDDAHIV